MNNLNKSNDQETQDYKADMSLENNNKKGRSSKNVESNSLIDKCNNKNDDLEMINIQKDSINLKPLRLPNNINPKIQQIENKKKKLLSNIQKLDQQLKNIHIEDNPIKKDKIKQYYRLQPSILIKKLNQKRKRKFDDRILNIIKRNSIGGLAQQTITNSNNYQSNSKFSKNYTADKINLNKPKSFDNSIRLPSIKIIRDLSLKNKIVYEARFDSLKYQSHKSQKSAKKSLGVAKLKHIVNKINAFTPQQTKIVSSSAVDDKFLEDFINEFNNDNIISEEALLKRQILRQQGNIQIPTKQS